MLQALATRGDVAADVPGKATDRYRLRDEQVPASKDTQEGSSEVSGERMSLAGNADRTVQTLTRAVLTYSRHTC